MLLNHFSDTLTLDKKIGVIIPQNLTYSEKYVKEFISMFSQFFGGASVMDVSGAYVMEGTGNVEYDESKMVYAYYQEMTDEQARTIAIKVKKCKMDLNQECIGLEYDGKFTMVF